MTRASRIVIRYHNLAGAVVAVSEDTEDTGVYRFGAQCAGCLDSQQGVGAAIAAARIWANGHAAECRALPPLDAKV